MAGLIWKAATKSLKDLPIQYYAYMKQSNPKFFPGNYFTIPETIDKGLEFLQHSWPAAGIQLNTLNHHYWTDLFKESAQNSQELYSSVLCLDLLSDLENVSKAVLIYLKSLIRFVLKIAPFNFEGIQDVLSQDVSSAALITWVLMKERVLTKHAARYLARLVISKSHEKPMDPITSVNVMRLLYQVGLHDESTEDFLYVSLDSRSYLQNENCSSPDAFLYFLSAMIANCPMARERFEELLITRLEERIGKSTEVALDSSMRILAFESVGLLESAKMRNRLCEEFNTLTKLQALDGSWTCSKTSSLWSKGIGIGVQLLCRDGKVITSAFALKAVHVFYEQRKKFLAGNETLSKSHIIS